MFTGIFRILNPLSKIGPVVAVSCLLIGAQGSFGADSPTKLTLERAESIALANHPKISGAQFRAMVAREDVVEARSGYLPTFSGEVSAVGTLYDGNNTMSAGALTVSSIYEREAQGLNLKQLVTDFGRTGGLTDSAKLHYRAQKEGVVATEAQILVAVKVAYYRALQAQAVVNVANKTVETRQLVFENVQAKTESKLKSSLDLSFADVTVGEAQVLLASAQRDHNTALAKLSNLLGDEHPKTYLLEDQALSTTTNRDGASVQDALLNRPEVAQAKFEAQAAQKFARAERALNYPSVSLAGTVGFAPYHANGLVDRYGAAGVILHLPLFDGMLSISRDRQAQFKAKVADENLRDLQNDVVRDVKIAEFDREHAYEQLGLTDKLLRSANDSLDLAQERYKVGSTSIVELTQAQLSQTQAEVANIRAKYDCLISDALLDYADGRMAAEVKNRSAGNAAK